MNKVSILLLVLVHFEVQLFAQWEPMEMDVYQSWAATTKIDAFSDDGNFFFYGGATPVDTNGQQIMNGFLFSTYHQGVIQNKVLVNNPIRSVVKFQGDTVLAGAFHTVYYVDSFPSIQASIERVLVLNDGSIQQLGNFNHSTRVKLIDSKLFFFGHFNMAMDDSCNVITWDGESWEIIGPPIDASFSEIRDVAYYNDELYVAGNLLTNNGIHDLLVLRDGEWQSVGEPIQTGISSFNKLTVYNGELYAAGMIRKIDGFAGNMIQRWNGEVWQEVGNSLYYDSPNSFAQVWDMKVYEDYLYVSGVFLTAGGIDAPCIARWDGSQWCGMFTQGTDGSINSFAFTGGDLYVRQIFDGIPSGNPAFIHRYTMGDEVFPCSEVFTGLDDESEVVFSLHPNPCTDHFYLEFPNTTNQPLELVIYTLTGQLVRSQQLSGNQRHTIDVSGLEAGMYVVQLMENGQPAGTSKLVVQGR